MKEERCIICGDIIPEGLMVCPLCSSGERSEPRAQVKTIRVLKGNSVQEFIKRCIRRTHGS